MKFESVPLYSILEENSENKIVLPNFQRGYVWDENKQRELLASFLLGLPIGNILMLKGTKDYFSAREICSQEPVTPKEDCIYLLDGQQRISTLKAVFSDDYDKEPEHWKSIWDKTFGKLRKRWFINIAFDADEDIDIFNYKELYFDRNRIKEYEPSQIITILKNYPIQAGNKNMWFHPAFNPADMDDKSRRNKIAKAASEECMVPLYELFQTEKKIKPLYTLTLERIANTRYQDLKNITENDNEKIIYILEKVQPDIRELIDDNDSIAIERAWINLNVKWVNEVSSFLESIMSQEIAQIVLPKDEIPRAFAIFEVINSGGMPLGEYDLIVAKAARNRELPPLTERIIRILNKDIEIPPALTERLVTEKPKIFKPMNMGATIKSDKNELSKSFKRKHYLNLLSIFSNTEYGEPYDQNGKVNIRGEYLKRTKILSLSFDEINNNTEKTVRSLSRTLCFLNIRCGIISLSELPYQLMTLPIAYTLLNDNFWTDKEKLDRIEYWYWASLFSGTYQFEQDKTAIKDIALLYSWLEKNDNPFENRFKDILCAPKFSSLDVLLCKDDDNLHGAGILKAILQYVLSKQPRDFLDEDCRFSAWNVSEDRLKLQDHHICPLSGAAKLGQSSKKIRDDKSHILNSPLNRTYISSVSNSVISDKKPENYFEYVSESSRFGHCIPTPINEKFKKRKDETEQQYYDRVLTERYEELYKKIKEELEQLAH
ncbi:DUF262 [Desulfonema limicola]|uniref:DUF262 n=1 Tax=Desulfonema limicola TaxID=45656 RepID=A0A975GEK6_9BACT|nr:DUF262 domain-containing protein [Desulfonema limicola]QTA78326.1 DUF262 [Desulfonema limicola]